MKFYDVSFFNWGKERKDISVHFEDGLIRINTSENRSDTPNITIHTDDGDLPVIQFKNAVISAFESYMRKRKAEREARVEVLELHAIDMAEAELRISALLGGDLDDC